MGVIYYDLGEYELACEHLQKAKKLGYKKIHDRNDLQAYLELSCKNAVVTKQAMNIEKSPIKEHKLSDKPFIYPNPTNGELNIQNIAFSNFNYLVMDYTGKLLTQGRSDKKSLNISGLPSGIYILKITNKNVSKTFRVVKE